MQVKGSGKIVNRTITDKLFVLCYLFFSFVVTRAVTAVVVVVFAVFLLLFFFLSAYVSITYSFDLRQEECSFRAIFIATNETHSNWLSSISHTVSIYGKHISALKI